TATVITTVQGIGSEVKDDAKGGEILVQETVLPEQSLKKEHKEDDLQPLGVAGSIQGQAGVEESVLQESSERSEILAATEESTEGRENVVIEDREEISEAQRTVEEPSSRDFNIIKAVTPKEELLAKQEPSEQEKLPTTDLTVDETRDECISEVQAAVQDKTERETSTLGLTAEESVQLAREDKILTVGPECTEAAETVILAKSERQDEIPHLDSQEQ
ncbi:hypothetical protein M959_02344, partial [Chaetura pelagica]